MAEHHQSYAGALWYRPLTRENVQLNFGLEYRYTNYEDNNLLKDDHMIGVLMRLQLYKAKGFRL